MTPDEILSDPDQKGQWIKVTGTVTRTHGRLSLDIALDPGVLPESFQRASGHSYERAPQEGFLNRLFHGASRPLQPGDRIEGLVRDNVRLHQPSLPALAAARNEAPVYVEYIAYVPSKGFKK